VICEGGIWAAVERSTWGLIYGANLEYCGQNEQKHDIPHLRHPTSNSGLEPGAPETGSISEILSNVTFGFNDVALYTGDAWF
jgi:hypothetical protein